MKKIINKYLTKNYLIVNDRFYSKLTCKLYKGIDVVTEFVEIFDSTNEEVLEIIGAWLKRRKFTPFDISKMGFETNKLSTTRLVPVPYEPKRRNRWLIKFPELFEIDACFLKSASRPSMKFEYDKNSWVGRTVWDDIEIELNDVIAPSISQRVFALINNEHYHSFQFILELLDPIGVPIERWTINALIKSVDFGYLDYSSTDNSTIKLTLSVINCNLIF